MPQLERNLHRDSSTELSLAGSASMGHSSGLCPVGCDGLENEHLGRQPMAHLSLEKQSAITQNFSQVFAREELCRSRKRSGLEMPDSSQHLQWEPSIKYLLSPPPKHLSVPAARFGFQQGCVTLDLTKLEHICNRVPC